MVCPNFFIRIFKKFQFFPNIFNFTQTFSIGFPNIFNLSQTFSIVFPNIFNYFSKYFQFFVFLNIFNSLPIQFTNPVSILHSKFHCFFQLEKNTAPSSHLLIHSQQQLKALSQGLLSTPLDLIKIKMLLISITFILKIVLLRVVLVYKKKSWKQKGKHG